MLYFWLIHYSLLKGLYKKRSKGMKNGVEALAIMTTAIGLIFILVFAWDKAFLASIFGNHFPIQLLRGIIFLLFVLSIIYLAANSSNRLASNHIETIRKVIELKRNLKIIYSWIYAFLFIILLLVTLIFGEKPRF